MLNLATVKVCAEARPGSTAAAMMPAASSRWDLVMTAIPRGRVVDRRDRPESRNASASLADLLPHGNVTQGTGLNLSGTLPTATASRMLDREKGGRMEVIIQRDYEQMSKAAAQVVVEVLNTKPNAVLGMATGSTPLGLYQELVRLFRAELIDFSRVTTFNLDEYVGLPMTHPQSYHHFMH